MKYNDVLGYITYQSKEHGECRLLDYADDWKLASEEEKRLICMASTAEDMYEALKELHQSFYTADYIHDAKELKVMNKALQVIAKAEGRE